MKFCFRLRLRKKNQFKKYQKSYVFNQFNHYDHHMQQQQQSEMPINEPSQLSNNMALTIDGSGDDQEKYFKQIPKPVDEQQIANAQEKVDRLINIITDTYEKTLIRNVHLEELDMRSTDLFRDAEKMKNMAHKIHDKFFWEDSMFLRIRISNFLQVVTSMMKFVKKVKEKSSKMILAIKFFGFIFYRL